MIIPLDLRDRHRLVRAGGALTLASDERDDLVWPLRRHLRFVVDGNERRLTADSPAVPIGDARHVEVFLGPVRLGHLSGSVADIRRLSPFESRYLATYNRPFPAPESPTLFRPRTDLHTHFAGCVRARDLLAIGRDLGCRFDVRRLERAGISADASLPIDDAIAAKLAASLELPLDRAVPFPQLQGIYDQRAPVTKDPRAFLRLCAQLAADYRDMGVDYVELSLHQIASPEILALAHRDLPAIEAEHGVTLRFLAGFGRTDDHEWLHDYVDRVKQISESRYVVGVDVNGHETNSTRAFTPILREIAAWANRERPGFVIRVHAGENRAFPENIRLAAQCLLPYPEVELRIGHGLYGADDPQTLALLEQTGAIVEFNLNSNFALNNVQVIDERRGQLREYIRRNIPVVLGTDGYGIYQTTPMLEAQAAALCGLGEADFTRIRATEDDYVERRAVLDRSKPAAWPVPPWPPEGRRWTAALERQRGSEQLARDERLLAHLDGLGVSLLAFGEERLAVERPAVDQFLRSYDTVISFGGAWWKSWARVSDDHQAAVAREMRTLLESLARRGRILVVTGGTSAGVEAVVQGIAETLGLDRLGVLVREIDPQLVAPGNLTHAVVVGTSIYDKAGPLYRLLRECDGVCVFVGGGVTVGDEIQAAANLHLRYLLMDGPTGASTDHARERPEHAFTTAEEALVRLAALRPSRRLLRFRGVNPAVDAVVLRTGAAGQREVLLIRRVDDDRPTAGRWALPGGFVGTDSRPGDEWRDGRETRVAACVRELREETHLAVAPDALRVVGVYDAPDRDPRNTAAAQVVSTAFVVDLGAAASGAVVGDDDAAAAGWHEVGAAIDAVAFDHPQIIRDALQLVG